jgi:citrate lyase subunit beta / citryl-CoA lyase
MPSQRDDDERARVMPRRSWLFVPGDSPSKLAKIANCGADAVIIDLEDSVTADAKQTARANTRDFLKDRRPEATSPALYVRVNGLGTGITQEDLAAAISPATTGIMLPKAEGGLSVAELAATMRVAEARAGVTDGATSVIAIATETARGVLSVGTYADSTPRLEALAWGAEDLSADIGAYSARDNEGNFTPLFAHARTMVLLGAANAGIAAIDGIYANFRDEVGLRSECNDACRDGFTGKMAIHPAQIAVINEAFTPTAAALATAQEIVQAFAAAGNAGVINFDGRMLDKPHLKVAQRIIAQAEVQN